jgi:predicted DNA-binding transcriptional regulator AlpA
MDSEIRRERLTEPETAHYIGMSRPWLRLQRMRGTGPPYIRIGRAIRYDIRDLDAWLAKHRVECT